MNDQNSGQRLLKSRRREWVIVIAALVVVCAIGLAVRGGVIQPMLSSQPDVAAK